MKTILMRTPNALDGVSLYRHWGPILALEKEGLVRPISMNSDSEITHWHYYKKSHLAFVNRPTRVFDEAFIFECMKHSVPVWIDIDDNVFKIPPENEAAQYFNPNALKILFESLSRARVVTVATGEMKSFLQDLGGPQLKPILIPNALDDSLLKYGKSFSGNRKIIWRGSKAGERALRLYSKVISDTINDWPEAHWKFMGLNPYWISALGVPESKPSVNYIDYILELSNFNASFSFMTHTGSDFDRAKSTNGWIESTLTGSVCLVPDFGDWSALGDMVFKYKVGDEESFYYNFNKMLKTSHDKLREKCHNSLVYITKNLLLSNINQKRMEIINNL